MGGGKGKNNANGFPFDRRRTLPMGISNSGVNCWYSSLSQLLFHIPAARRAIFEIQPYSGNDSHKNRCWRMCKELQLQFAIMQDRHQDSVSPIASLSAMNDLFPGDGVQYEQKDAVEMFTRLLSFLETITESASKESPLTEIFGGVVHDLKFENGVFQWHVPAGKKEIFSFALNPSLGNLHSAMEDVFAKSDHQRWIAEAAPVLLLPIARYTYHGGVVRKKNDRFEFPQEIFLDRYMSANMERVFMAKSQFESSQSTAAHYRGRLAKLNPVSNNQKLGLISSFLKYFEFLRDNWGRISDDTRRKREELEIRQHLSRYESMPNQLEGDEFKKIPYDLHVVIMHCGSAQSGHYYAYARRPHYTSGSEWLCCNDSFIGEVTWDDVAREAFGRQSTSAFALLYIRRSEFDRLYDYENLLNTNVDDCLLDPMKCLPEHVKRMLQAHYGWTEQASDKPRKFAKRKGEEEKDVNMPVFSTTGEQQNSKRDRRNKLRDEASKNETSNGTKNDERNAKDNGQVPMKVDEAHTMATTQPVSLSIGKSDEAHMNLDEGKTKESKNYEHYANDSGQGPIEMDEASIVTATQPAPPSIGMTRKIRVAILFSGQGRSIENLVKAGRQPDSLYEVVVVYTNVRKAPGREVARELDVSSYFVCDEDFLITLVIGDRLDIICMDGCTMRLKKLRELCREKIVDVLPTINLEFCDNPYNGPISAGKRVTGSTFYRLLTANTHPITIVDEESVRVPDDATPDTLKEMIRSAAMDAYPRAVTRLANQIITANTIQ